MEPSETPIKPDNPLVVPVVEPSPAENPEAGSDRQFADSIVLDGLARLETPAAETLPATPPASKSRIWQALREILETVVLAAALFLVINLLTARIRVDGASMEPTLYTGEFVMVNRLAYKFTPPQRGDIVIFDLPRQPTRDYIKRIIGLPGDHVEIKNRMVYVNGQALQEPYIADQPAYTGAWTVPDGTVFALGDNRNNSTDSHSWGAIPLEHIVGRAIVIYWPPQRWAILGNVSPMPKAEP